MPPKRGQAKAGGRGKAKKKQLSKDSFIASGDDDYSGASDSGQVKPTKSTNKRKATTQPQPAATKKVVLSTCSVAVDKECQNKDNYIVYQKDGVIYNTYLTHKTEEKIYIAQLLQDKQTPEEFHIFFRWSQKKSEPGNFQLKGPLTEDNAIKEYNKKIQEKTGKGEYQESKPEIKKIVVKGGVAVDPEVPRLENYRVFQKQGKIYASILNFCDLRENNNKFYVIQLIQSEDNPKLLHLFTRWGRVGEKGNQSFLKNLNEDVGITKYNDKLYEKTELDPYVIIHVKYDDDEEIQVANLEDKKKEGLTAFLINLVTTPSVILPDSVISLINLIFDMKIMNVSMQSIGYDPSKCPLGKLSELTIKDGYTVLNQLLTAIHNNKGIDEYIKLSGKFYSLIPHEYSRSQKMIHYVLDNEEKVKSKLDMLAALSDMKITTELLKNNKDSNFSANDIIENYKKLNCQITPVQRSDSQFKTIEQYLDCTKEGWKYEIIDIFSMDRKGEKERFTYDIGNNMLLFHGSRVSNFVGIISQGLRIAPPEAPVSGYLYGKGLYFADMFDKSACYCRKETSNNEILLLLVQVAVGKPNILEKTDYNAGNLPQGKDSVKAWGQVAPPEESYIDLPVDKSIQVPQGKPQRTKSKHYMTHNEFIVYNQNQAMIKYLIRCKVNN